MSNTASQPPSTEAPTDALLAAEHIKALAITDVRAALSMADRLLDGVLPVRSRLRLLAARAHARCYANDFALAESDLDEAAALAADAGLDDEIGPLLLVRVQPLARAGKLDEAERVAAAAARRLSAPGQASLRGKAEVNLGIVRRMKGHAAESIECFDRAAALLCDDKPALAAVHSNRAVALLELDQFDRASESFQQAMSLLRDAGRTHAAAIVTGNIADLCARTGRIDIAIARFDEARALFQASGATADAARLTAEEAEALFSVGALVKCVRLVRDALPALEQAGLVRELARARLVHGLAMLRLGDLSGARAALERAAEQAAAASAPLVRAEAHIGLAEVCGAERKFDDARRHALTAAELLSERPVRLAAAMLALAAIEIDHNPEQAIETIDRAWAGLGAEAPGPLKARIAHIRAIAQRRQGRDADALTGLLAAMRVAESFRASIRAEQIRTAYLESTQQIFLDTAAVALDVLPLHDAAPVVFDAIERVRGRCLLDAIRGSGTSLTTADPALCEPELAELNALYASLGPTSTDGSPEVERRRARLHSLEAAREALADRSAHRDPRGPIADDPISLSDAARRIPANVAVISYFPDGDCYSAQTLRSGREVTVRKLITRADAGALSRRFRLAIGRSLAGFAADSNSAVLLPLVELRAALLGPLEPELAGVDRLFFMPFGELHGIPLHAPAIVRAAEHSHRIESYLPGVGVGLALSSPARCEPSARRVAVIGYADQLAPHIEAESIESAACHPDATVLIGRNAVAAAAFDAIASADLIHIACHAVFDPDFPMSSRLQLADRWVSARELIGRMKPGAAVILAGCDTGRTRSSIGEERLGLVWGALASGASAVLAAAWPLHDAVARRALVGVHRALAASDAPYAPRLAAELTTVQRQLAASGEPIHTWANLFVSGALS